MSKPVSAPEPVETGAADLGEHIEQGKSGDVAGLPASVGHRWDSETARAAALLRASEARQTQRSDVDILSDLIAGQVSIATGRAKGTTPTARTAAAKAASDLMAERERRRSGDDATQVDWQAVPPIHRRAIALLLEADEEAAALVAQALSEAAGGAARSAEEQKERA